MTKEDLQNLTISEFGQIPSDSLTVLFERGIHTIEGLTLEFLGKLYIAVMKDEPADWQIDLRDVTIEELVSTYSREIRILVM